MAGCTFRVRVQLFRRFAKLIVSKQPGCAKTTSCLRTKDSSARLCRNICELNRDPWSSFYNHWNAQFYDAPVFMNPMNTEPGAVQA